MTNRKNMSHSPVSSGGNNSLWNNSQPLAALHQMTEMNPAANFLRFQHQQQQPQQSAKPSGVTTTTSGTGNHNGSSSPLSGAAGGGGGGATPHGINDILSRNASALAAISAANNAAVQAATNHSGNPVSGNGRFLFNPQTLMSGTKHFQVGQTFLF